MCSHTHCIFTPHVGVPWMGVVATVPEDPHWLHPWCSNPIFHSNANANPFVLGPRVSLNPLCEKALQDPRWPPIFFWNNFIYTGKHSQTCSPSCTSLHLYSVWIYNNIFWHLPNATPSVPNPVYPTQCTQRDPQSTQRNPPSTLVYPTWASWIYFALGTWGLTTRLHMQHTPLCLYY